MATRAEQYRAEEERGNRKAPKRKAQADKPGVAPQDRTRARKRVAKKATYALEESTGGARPSRKSTRKSANRAKPDAALTRREAGQKGSPESRYAKTRARATKARGKPSG